MPYHESDEKICKNVFAESTVADSASLLSVKKWIPVPLTARAPIAALHACPHTIWIKTEFIQNVWMNPKIVELPFSCSSGEIARIF
jgi:hypothetical protein